jgi:hypothetical protein
MNVRSPGTSSNRSPVALGCVSALAASLVASCALVGLAAAPVLGGTVNPTPDSDPNRPDITVIVAESYLNEVVGQAMPTAVPGEVTVDIRADSLLVATASFDLLLTKLEVITTTRLSVSDGQLQISIESVETGGKDILDLIGLDSSAFDRAISKSISDQVEAGLGDDAEILEVSSDENSLVLKARWPR